MKKLIIKGQRRFANRKDRDYIEELSNIGISEEVAWNIILSLSKNDYYFDYKPNYRDNNSALIFKKIINKKLVYIKLILEEYNGKELTVCLSFHIDYE